MEDKKLCVCVPTYNRKTAIQKFLMAQAAVFEKHNIDIFVCDSSPNDDIRQIVDDYCNKGYENIFYRQYPTDMSSNVKVYKIFQQAAGSEYDFVWMIHDHTICTEHAVENIMTALDGEYDFYVLNMQADEFYIKEFAKLNEFLLESAWRLNSFGASILKTSTFLKDVAWEQISDKYNVPDMLNYSHIGFYFEQAATLKELKACQIFFDRKDFIDFQRTESISWGKDVLRICLECWGSVISALPDCYTNKLAVLRSQDRWFLSKYSLLAYKKNGYYSLKEFLKYHRWIKYIYPEAYYQNFLIACMPYHIANRWVNKDLLKNIKEKKKQGGQIYIFGAGRHATECASYLKEIRVDFNGFLVSNLKGNPSTLMDHCVYVASEELKDKNCLVILAILTSGIAPVKKMLRTLEADNERIDVYEF